MKNTMPLSRTEYLYHHLFIAARNFLACRDKWLDTMSIEDNRKLNTSILRMRSIIDDLHRPLD